MPKKDAQFHTRAASNSLENINVDDKTFLNLLSVAASSNQVEAMRLLAEKNMTLFNQNSHILFNIAMQNGSLDVGYWLLEHNLDKELALCATAKHNFPKIAHLLLIQGADPNVPDLQGKRPIFYAITNGCMETLHLLLVYGVQNLVLGKHGSTAQQLAASTSDESLATQMIQLIDQHMAVRELIKASGASPTMKEGAVIYFGKIFQCYASQSPEHAELAMTIANYSLAHPELTAIEYQHYVKEVTAGKIGKFSILQGIVSRLDTFIAKDKLLKEHAERQLASTTGAPKPVVIANSNSWGQFYQVGIANSNSAANNDAAARPTPAEQPPSPSSASSSNAAAPEEPEQDPSLTGDDAISPGATL